MPLYQMDNTNNRLILIQPTDFAAQKMQERKDLQPLLRNHPQYIDQDLMILTEEFGDFEGSQRRVDLLGLDKEGNLVVIELKRDDGGSHMELQAIRYAAMVSALDLEAVVSVHEDFLKKHGKDETTARQAIIGFLNPDTPISNKPRIVLISPSFSREITTAVLWLNGLGLDIRCIEVKLYKLQNELYLDMEQVIPLPSAADYQFKMRVKSDAIQRSAVQKKGRNSIAILVGADILRPGMKVRMIKSTSSAWTIGTDNRFKAEYASNNHFKWDYDDSLFSITKLTAEIDNLLRGDPDAEDGVFAGPDYWALESDTVSLYEKAKAQAAADISSVDTSAS